MTVAGGPARKGRAGGCRRRSRRGNWAPAAQSPLASGLALSLCPCVCCYSSLEWPSSPQPVVFIFRDTSPTLLPTLICTPASWHLVQRCSCAWDRTQMAMFIPISPPLLGSEPLGGRDCVLCISSRTPSPFGTYILVPSSPPVPLGSGTFPCAGSAGSTWKRFSPTSSFPPPPHPNPEPLLDDGEIWESSEPQLPSMRLCLVPHSCLASFPSWSHFPAPFPSSPPL